MKSYYTMPYHAIHCHTHHWTTKNLLITSLRFFSQKWWTTRGSTPSAHSQSLRVAPSHGGRDEGGGAQPCPAVPSRAVGGGRCVFFPRLWELGYIWILCLIDVEYCGILLDILANFLKLRSLRARDMVFFVFLLGTTLSFSAF